MPENPNPFGLIWLFFALFLCGALFFFIPVSGDTEQIFESFSMPGDSSTHSEENATVESTMPEAAADADVTYVVARQTGPETWQFSVTVEHPDTGWEDYADGWDVVLPDGTVVKANPDDAFTRVLLHPHENEQPFTRSQSGLNIPAEVTEVRVRAHDLVDGWGGREVVVDLTAASGEDFEVQRQ